MIIIAIMMMTILHNHYNDDDRDAVRNPDPGRRIWFWVWPMIMIFKIILIIIARMMMVIILIIKIIMMIRTIMRSGCRIWFWAARVWPMMMIKARARARVWPNEGNLVSTASCQIAAPLS